MKDKFWVLCLTVLLEMYLCRGSVEILELQQLIQSFRLQAETIKVCREDRGASQEIPFKVHLVFRSDRPEIVKLLIVCPLPPLCSWAVFGYGWRLDKHWQLP